MSTHIDAEIQIAKEPLVVSPRVNEVVALADSAKDSFGFLADSAYEDQAKKGQLWLALDKQSDDLLGYILFGGKFPHLKVFQIYVVASAAKRGIGRLLLSELTQFAIDHSYLYVTAKVATDLEANKFWQSMGLRICDQIAATKTKRAKNVYILELPAGSLFDPRTDERSDFEYENITQLRNLRFVLDVNVYFDAVKQRKYADDAMRVFRLGLTGRLELAVTAEFITELKRHSPIDSNDPLLELAQAFPCWPDIPIAAKSVLLEKLRSDVFPDRSLTRKAAAQDTSDLTHLATCVHFGADGFITREGAILGKSQMLKEEYGLNVLSPADLLDVDLLADIDADDMTVSVGSSRVSIEPLSEPERQSANAFLEGFDFEKRKASYVLSPSHQDSSRPCLLAKSGDRIVGILSCNQPDLDSAIVAWLYVDERAWGCDRIIDHFFQEIESSQVPGKLRFIQLSMSTRQPLTYETAFANGYRRTATGSGAGHFQLAKWSFRGPLYDTDWKTFRNDFTDATSLTLPEIMPSYQELQNTGLFVRSRKKQTSFSISLRDFETLTSTFVVAKDRPCVIIPIRLGFARQLFGISEQQRQLSFPQPEALLRSERVYFCRPPGPTGMSAGGLIVFYVSAHQGGNKAAVGIARVTSNRKLNADTIATSLCRQGVLTAEDLREVSNTKNEVVAITFDNYIPFPNEVSWDQLQGMGCIGGANLVRSQPIDIMELTSILRLAYGEE